VNKRAGTRFGLLGVVIVFVLVGVGVAIVVVPKAPATPTSAPPVQPNVSFSDGPPHAGKTFLGVVISFGPPRAFRVKRIWCRATLGGHFVTGGNGKELTGGRLIHAYMRSYYDHQSGGAFTGQKPRLSAVTCEWRLPRNASGKLLSLQPPGCSDVCQDWGVTIWYQRFDYDRQTWSGQGDANYYGATWRVRR
jgi:hypothetical protein